MHARGALNTKERRLICLWPHDLRKLGVFIISATRGEFNTAWWAVEASWCPALHRPSAGMAVACVPTLPNIMSKIVRAILFLRARGVLKAGYSELCCLSGLGAGLHRDGGCERRESDVDRSLEEHYQSRTGDAGVHCAPLKWQFGDTAVLDFVLCCSKKNTCV
jgi:hypothetical protein